MAGKTSGLGDNLYVGGYNLSGDIGAIDSISSPRGVLDDTGIDKLAHERLLSTKDGEISFTSFFNVDTAQEHPVLSVLPTTDIGVMYMRGTTAGNPAAAMIGKQVGYDPTRGADGSLTFKVQALASGYGLEWGKQLTAGTRTDTTATQGASLDNAASSAFGLQAYLQVFGFTGTDVTIKLQDSADNASWADLTAGAFAQVTAGRQTQRLATANNATVRRYLRVTTTTSGGFTSAAFAVMVTRNPVAGVTF